MAERRGELTERPNKQALTEALDILRDAMRPFIVRNLKKVKGQKPADAVRKALSGDRQSVFERDIEAGRSLEESIDIGDLPAIVRTCWRDAFSGAFNTGTKPLNTLQEIAGSRIQVAHPGLVDIHYEYTLDRLDDIIRMLAEINAPEGSDHVAAIRESLTPFTTPAHKLRQGGRDVYAFTLDLETLNRLLPDRVEDRLVHHANRPLTPRHANAIQEYLVKKDSWLLGTLLLGIAPYAVRFEAYPTSDGKEADIGNLTLLDTSAAAMKMFDGQHRRRAIKSALEELSQTERRYPELQALSEASLPIMLYVEDSIPALQQMFADAAQTRVIEQNTLTRFDQTSAFNLAALWIAENSDLFGGRVEFEKPSVSRTSHSIIAINQLAAALRSTEVGHGGRVSQARNQDFMIEIEALYERCQTWADDFMPSARSEYNDLIAGDIDDADIPELRNRTFAFNATVIRILAGSYYEWTRAGRNWQELADYLRDASLVLDASDGSILHEAGAVAGGGTSPMAGSRYMATAVSHIIRNAKEVLQ